MKVKVLAILLIVLFALCIAVAISTGKRANKEISQPKPELIKQIDLNVSNQET